MTGGVLALASYPTYDLSAFQANFTALVQDPLNPMRNRATMERYAPGSIFKPVTAIAALQEGIITTKTQILDTGRYMFYAPSYTPACWIFSQYGRTHGLETVSGAIRDSCNVFFYDVGRRVGIERLSAYGKLFGLGEYTGIEISEIKGYRASPETSAELGIDWYDGNTLSAAIGQDNNLFTPIQLANYIATLVNGGEHYPVHLLKSVKSSDYSRVVHEYVPAPNSSIPITAENLAAVKLGMYEVTQTASVARYFNALPVKAGAKTGTAQVNNNTGTNATFVCFAPYDDPQIAMCIVVEKGSSGSSLAALAAEILQYSFTGASRGSAVVGENQLMR
jgi:penicillin-binding protein 2